MCLHSGPLFFPFGHRIANNLHPCNIILRRGQTSSGGKGHGARTAVVMELVSCTVVDNDDNDDVDDDDDDSNSWGDNVTVKRFFKVASMPRSRTRRD